MEPWWGRAGRQRGCDLRPAAVRRPRPACRNSYVRLRHLCTNTWIQSSNVPIDIEEERPIRLMVRAARGWGAEPGGWAGPWLVPGCPADLCPCSWAPAPPRRTRRPLPSCRCPCPRSETWTSPTMPAPCWPVLWRNSTRASSARMTAGGSHSRALEGSAFHEPRGHKAEAGQAWLAGVGETEVGTGSGRFWWMGPGPLPHVLLMYSQNQP